MDFTVHSGQFAQHLLAFRYQLHVSFFDALSGHVQILSFIKFYVASCGIKLKLKLLNIGRPVPVAARSKA